MAAHDRDRPPPGGSDLALDDRARAVLFEAVEASFAEGIARQEITDGAAARTWLKRFAAAHAPEDRRHDVLEMLGCVPRVRRPIDPSLVKDAGQPLATVLRTDVVAWHDKVKTLSHGSLDVVPEPPPSILASCDAGIRRQHESGPLAAYPAWPVSEPAPRERQVLLLRVAGTSQAKNDDDVRQVLVDLDAGGVLLVEFTTPATVMTSPAPGMVGPFSVRADDSDIASRPSLASRYRTVLTSFLETMPGAQLVDEVAVVVPLGPKALVTAAMLAAVDFSLRAAVPLRVVTPSASHGANGPVTTTRVGEDSDRALASLGLDPVLADLASTAMANLDLSVAERLLRRGSARLHPLADDVRNLRRDAFGVVPLADGRPGRPDRTSAAELAYACARLRLVATIADRHPWDAAYLASSVADHTFRMPAGKVRACDVDGIGHAVLTAGWGWVVGPDVQPASNPQDFDFLAPWKTVRLRQNGLRPSSALRTWRNNHPLSHGIDDPLENRKKKRDAKRERITVPSADEIRQLLAEAETELRDALRTAYPALAAAEPDPDVLVRRHRELLRRAGRLAGAGTGAGPGQEDRAANAANGSPAAAAAGTSVPAGAPPARNANTFSATSRAASK